MAVPNEFVNGTVADASLINENFAYVGMVPVGTILDWCKSFTNTPALDNHFVECNGQVLSDAESIYNGQTIPNLNGSGATTGTATSGAATTITQSTASWTTNAFAGFVIKLTGGTGSGQFRQVVSNTATAITIQGNWTTNPASGTTFSVSSPQRFLRGATTSGGTGGEDAHLMTIGELVAHNHSISGGSNSGSVNRNDGTGSTQYTNSTGGSQAFSELPSYYETVKIIRIK